VHKAVGDKSSQQRNRFVILQMLSAPAGLDWSLLGDRINLHLLGGTTNLNIPGDTLLLPVLAIRKCNVQAHAHSNVKDMNTLCQPIRDKRNLRLMTVASKDSTFVLMHLSSNL